METAAVTQTYNSGSSSFRGNSNTLNWITLDTLWGKQCLKSETEMASLFSEWSISSHVGLLTDDDGG